MNFSGTEAEGAQGDIVKDTDPAYFERPEGFLRKAPGYDLRKYEDSGKNTDQRVSYTNSKWPFIEQVHKFRVAPLR